MYGHRRRPAAKGDPGGGADLTAVTATASQPGRRAITAQSGTPPGTSALSSAPAAACPAPCTPHLGSTSRLLSPADPSRPPPLNSGTGRPARQNWGRRSRARQLCATGVAHESKPETPFWPGKMRTLRFTTLREMPIIHSQNAADSRGRPAGPGSAGGGAGHPRTRSQRRIAGSYSPHATGLVPARDAGAGVRAVAATSRPWPLWCPLPGRPPRRPCPFGEQPVSGVGSSLPSPDPPIPAGQPWPARRRMITSGRPVCRLAPEGRVPPAACSGALSLASGVGSRAIATGSGVPIPFPLRPDCFCRSRRACQVRRDAPSLKFPATGAGSSHEPCGCAGPDHTVIWTTTRRSIYLLVSM